MGDGDGRLAADPGGRHIEGVARRAIRLVIADDHALLRQALRALLEREHDLCVAGEAADGREAVEQAVRLLPDVVLMDMAMPGLNGIDATRQIAKRAPASRVLVVTGHAVEERVLQALRAGAQGVVVKSSDLEELVLAIRSVSRGNTFFSAELARDFPVDEVVMRASRGDTLGECDVLTGREREVLQLIAEGLTNTRIADELVVTVKTVEAHKAHIAGKLGTGNRADLIRYAIRGGLVALDRTGVEEAPLLAG